MPYEALDSNDPRALKFYCEYFSSPHQHTHPMMKEWPSESTPKVWKSALFAHLTEHFSSYEERKQIIRILIDARTRGLVSVDRFEWLENDAHAGLYCYMSLPRGYDPSLTSNPSHTNNSVGTTRNPSSHKERYKLICEIFDDPYLINYAPKEQVLESIKEGYAIARQMVREYAWLGPSDKETIEWGWDYLKKYNENEQRKNDQTKKMINQGLSHLVSSQFGDEIGISILNQLNPVNTHETYLAIYCALRMWNCHPAEKTLFLRNFSKAWRQRVARQKEDQKTINAFVSVETKAKLDELRKTYRMPIGEVLEILIEDEYARHQPNERSVRKKN